MQRKCHSWLPISSMIESYLLGMLVKGLGYMSREEELPVVI